MSPHAEWYIASCAVTLAKGPGSISDNFTGVREHLNIVFPLSLIVNATQSFFSFFLTRRNATASPDSHWVTWTRCWKLLISCLVEDFGEFIGELLHFLPTQHPVTVRDCYEQLPINLQTHS